MTKIFADGASIEQIKTLAADPYIKGFTTNPTLMRKAGVTDYESFAKAVLEIIGDERPISFEVFADEPLEMRRQAEKIASWGENVNVKIPITTTQQKLLYDLIGDLSWQGITINVTAVFTASQVSSLIHVLCPNVPSFISVFAGRIADTGVDPVDLMSGIQTQIDHTIETQLIWASPREVLNYVQAKSIGCDIITMTADLIAKLSLIGKDHYEYSLETVQMFYKDGQEAGYEI